MQARPRLADVPKQVFSFYLPSSCISLALWMGLSGCQFQQKHDVPMDIQAVSTAEVRGEWSVAVPSAELGPWLESLESPALSQAVAEGLERSPALAAMRAQVDSSLARAGLVKSDAKPSVGVGVQSSRNRSNTSTPEAVYQSSTSVGLSASWEIDLWGQLKDERHAARLDVDAAEASLAAMELSITGSIVRAWLAAKRSAELLQNAEETLKLQRQLLEDIETAHDLGREASSRVMLQQTAVSSARTALEAAREEDRQDRLILSRALGQHANLDHLPEYDWPEFEPQLAARLPAEVLARRPDVRAAALKWESSRYQMKSSRKNRLPGMTLTSQLGTSSDDLSNLLDLNYLIWSLVGEISAPLMEGGSLLAQVQAADAESAQALADYAQVVLDALLEVEQALSREASLKLRQQQIKEQLKQTQWTEDALEADYTAGLIDFDVYQQGKLSTLDTQEKLKLNHHQVWDNRIQLYLALGQPAR